MPSPFDQAFSAYAAPQLHQQFGVRVRLERAGDEPSEPFTCSFARLVESVALDNEALGTVAERRTWWPVKTDLVAGGGQVTPRAGDRLQVLDDDDAPTGEIHELLPNGAEPAVERPPDGVHYVIRTKRVD